MKLAENADLLLTECAYRPGQIDEKWPHLNPESAARIAVESNAKKLILVHFDANNYQTFDDRRKAEDIAISKFPASFP